jgi:tellurite resistance protein
MSAEQAESPYMSVLRVWLALAWADGVVAPAEAEALRRLIAVAPIQEAERATALAWLDEPVELDTSRLRKLGAESRQGVYQAAVRLARIDLNVAAQERALLDRLRVALEIDEPTAAAIESRLTP